MELFIHESDEVSYVALGGRFDQTGVEEVEQPFTEATTGRGLPTIVDMSGITFMSSLGIGFLYANTKELKKAGCKLVLLNPKGMVETVLGSSKMDRVMPIAYELEARYSFLGSKRRLSQPTFRRSMPRLGRRRLKPFQSQQWS
jgi:anti-anti-sigma factor